MLDQVLLFAVLGLAVGVVYAGLGVGLVTTFRGTGVVNLAQGAFAMWGAYVYAAMRTDGHLHLPLVGLPRFIDVGGAASVPVAVAAGVASSVVVALLCYTLVFRPLRNAPQLASVVAAIGITTILQAVATLHFGTQAQVVPSFYSQGTVELSGQQVPVSQLQALVVALAITTVVWAYFKFARVGLATMAVSESPRSISLFGYAPGWLAAGAWAVSGAVAGVVGILAAPIVQLSATNYTLFVVPALAAALLGRFRSIPAVFAGGLMLGIGQSELGYLRGQEWFPVGLQAGIQDALPFVVILVALLLGGRRVAGRTTALTGRLPAVRRPGSPLIPVAVLVVLTAVGLGTLSGTYRFGLIQSLIAALIMLSFVLLTGYAGQISIAQVALAGTAGLVMTRVSAAADLPFPVAALFGTAAAVALGTLVALPALRVRGIQLVVVTLAFAVATQSFVFGNPVLNPTDLPLVDPPGLLGFDLSVRAGDNIARGPFVVLCLLVVAASIVIVSNLMRGNTGLRMLAVRSNERVAASIGVNVTETKLLAFVVASALAGLSGALTVYSQTQFSGLAFDTLAVGLPLLAFAYLGGITSISGALVAALLAPGGVFYVLLNALFAETGLYYLLVTGTLLVLSAISYPEGIAGTVAGLLAPRLARLHERRAPATPTLPDAVGMTEQPARRSSVSELVVRDLTVRYGGVLAVDKANLRVRRGEIVGLIGPNGAGKTSLIDAISGFAAYEGDVLLDGERVSGEAAYRLSRRGVVRTWQNPDLFSDITVAENLAVAVAPDKALQGTLKDVLRRGASGRSTAHGVLASLGLAEQGDLSTNELSLGQQKLVGVARALANGPGVLLLDEPAAGLDVSESQQLGGRLRQLAQTGVGLLLVDHDMDLVFNTCDRVVVLVFGKVVADGSPAEVRADPAVIAAYLGAQPADDEGGAADGTPSSPEPEPAKGSNAQTLPRADEHR